MSYFDDASLVMIPSGYKDQKVYSVKPLDGSGDLTFSRASSATRVASNGLIEKVRTNLALQSQNFGNTTVWGTRNGTFTANAGTAPDGTNTAYKVTATDSDPYIYQSINTASLVTASCYVKGLGSSIGKNAQIRISGAATVDVVMTGDWQRITATGVTAGATNWGLEVPSIAAIGDEVLIWGFQAEVGDIATDYIATTSAAVSVGPVSGLPRLDYLDSTCPRLLLEPQRTNLALYSEQFNNASWTQSVPSGTLTLTSNYAVSPDGYQNADRLQYTGGSQYVQLYQILTHSTNVFSIYAKSNTGANQSFRIWGNDFAQVSSDLTVTSSWQRFDFAITGSGSKGVGIATASTGAALDISIYGAQFEAGAYATSYIPTLGTSVTRVADEAYKTSITSLIGQTEGTIFIDFAGFNGSAHLVTLGDGTAANYLMLYIDGSSIAWFSSGGLTGSAGTVTANSKAALAYKGNSSALYLNGVQILTNTSSTIPSLPNLYFNNNAVLSNINRLEVKQALLFKTRLTNAQLAELTTL